MKDTEPATIAIWHIIEPGDRWYQAVLRFTRSEAASTQVLIRRWDPAAAAGLIRWARQEQGRRTVLLWELPADPKSFLGTLELIATLNRVNPRAVQLAHVPARRSRRNALAVQEAGATFLLDDLWAVEKVARQLRCVAI